MKEFTPNWVTPPGETIQDLINERRLDADELQRKLGISNLESLLSGTMLIDQKLADALARELGPSAEFWIKREENYRRDKKRIEK